MADRTGIEWTDSTFNPWIGCTKISPACDHCYASVSTPARALGVEWGAGEPRRRTREANWKLPLRWNEQPYGECRNCGWRGEMRDCRSVPHPDDFTPVRGCPKCNSPCVWPARRRVFCASLADVFDNEVEIEWLVELLDLIRRTPNLDWLLLTKRIGNVGRIVDAALAAAATNDPLRAWIVDWWSNSKPPANVWLGATICNQAEADRDIPKLLETTAAVRFLSMEPLLGPVDLTNVYGVRHNAPFNVLDANAPGKSSRRCVEHAVGYCFNDCPGRLPALDWVIAGGESGPGARPMHPDWVRSLRDQCATAGVPLLFKQWGEWAPTSVAVTPDGGIPADSYTLRLLMGEWRDGVRRDLYVSRVGKKAASRLLDGVEHNGYPTP